MSRRPFTGIPARVLVALGLCSTALGAGGCGDDTERVSTEELVSRGDAICAEGRRQFDQVMKQGVPNAVAAAEQVDQLLEIATDELTELRRIRPPEELGERYDAYLEARGRALEVLRQGRDAAEAKDAKAYAEAQVKASAEQERRLKLARAVGFERCSAP